MKSFVIPNSLILDFLIYLIFKNFLSYFYGVGFGFIFFEFAQTLFFKTFTVFLTQFNLVSGIILFFLPFF